MTEENGGEGLSGLGNQRVSEMNLPENLRRCDPNSADVGFTPLNSEGPSSVPREDNEEGSISGFIYYEDYKNQVKELRNYCEATHNTITNLNKKIDIIKRKIAKIHHVRVKSLWQSRKPYGYAYKKYKSLLSRKKRMQEVQNTAPSPFKSSISGSYSPTVPVGRRDDDSNSYPAVYYQSDESPEQIQDVCCSQDVGRSASQTSYSSSFPPSYQPCDFPNNLTQDNSPTQYSRAGPQGINNTFAPSHASITASTVLMAQDRTSEAHNPDMGNYPPLLENRSLDYTTSSLHIPADNSTIPLVVTDPCMLQQSCSGDPSTWSVEDVIVFLNNVDPHMLPQLADIFREHDIDGKALLLMNSDMLTKYLGLKIGTTVKLCYYIEKLKGGKGINW